MAIADLPWYADHGNLRMVVSWMFDRCDSQDNILYFLEKPWKWQQEFQALQSIHDAGIDPDDVIEFRVTRDNKNVDVQLHDPDTDGWVTLPLKPVDD